MHRNKQSDGSNVWENLIFYFLKRSRTSSEEGKQQHIARRSKCAGSCLAAGALFQVQLILSAWKHPPLSGLDPATISWMSTCTARARRFSARFLNNHLFIQLLVRFLIEKTRNCSHWFYLLHALDALFPLSARITDALFEDIERTVQRGQDVGDDQLAALRYLFERQMDKAAKIVDQPSNVVCYVGLDTGRMVFQVQGSSANSAVRAACIHRALFEADPRFSSLLQEKYLVFPRHYCTCHSFFFDVVSGGSSLYCKHQLAARQVHSLATLRIASFLTTLWDCRLAYSTNRCTVFKVPDEYLVKLMMDA